MAECIWPNVRRHRIGRVGTGLKLGRFRFTGEAVEEIMGVPDESLLERYNTISERIQEAESEEIPEWMLADKVIVLWELNRRGMK